MSKFRGFNLGDLPKFAILTETNDIGKKSLLNYIEYKFSKRCFKIDADFLGQAISNLSNRPLTVVEDINYVLVENEEDAKFYSWVTQKFQAASFLGKDSTRLLFIPVGVKKFDTDLIDQLNKKIKEIDDDISKFDSEDARGVKSKIKETQQLLKRIRGENDIGGGCSEVKKRLDITEYEEVGSNNLGILSRTPKKIKDNHVSEVIWGLLDRDKSRKSKDTLYAIDVYSFENYLCMPLNLFYMIKRDADFNDPENQERLSHRLKEVESLINGNSENDKQELQSLIKSLSYYAINTIKNRISVSLKAKDTSHMPISNIMKLQDGLNGPTKHLKLANGMVIEDCPEIFFEGLPGGGNGHKLLETIGFLMYGNITKGFVDKMKSSIFGALEKVPAALLPYSLLSTIEGIKTSKRVELSKEMPLKENSSQEDQIGVKEELLDSKEPSLRIAVQSKQSWIKSLDQDQASKAAIKIQNCWRKYVNTQQIIDKSR